MPESKRGHTLAITSTFACYPHERAALLRIMSEQKLKSVFDVVRLLASESRSCGVQAGDFCPPKLKS
jgi:hypothetical protein